jgi:hypothetical protein
LSILNENVQINNIHIFIENTIEDLEKTKILLNKINIEEYFKNSGKVALKD